MTLNVSRKQETESVFAGLNFAGRRGRASEAITDNPECPSIPASIQCAMYGMLVYDATLLIIDSAPSMEDENEERPDYLSNIC